MTDVQPKRAQGRERRRRVPNEEGGRAAGSGSGEERGEDRGNEGEDGGRNDDHVSDLSKRRRCDGGQRSKGRVGVDEVLALES